MIIEFLKLLQNDINSDPDLTTVHFRPLEENSDDVFMRIQTSSPETEFFDRGEIVPQGIQFLSKRNYEFQAVEDLQAILTKYSKLSTYPQPESGFQWITAYVGQNPSIVSRETDGKYIYTCTLICKLSY